MRSDNPIHFVIEEMTWLYLSVPGITYHNKIFLEVKYIIFIHCILIQYLKLLTLAIGILLLTVFFFKVTGYRDSFF